MRLILSLPASVELIVEVDGAQDRRIAAFLKAHASGATGQIARLEQCRVSCGYDDEVNAMYRSVRLRSLISYPIFCLNDVSQLHVHRGWRIKRYSRMRASRGIIVT
jgi:hypothetical protein